MERWKENLAALLPCYDRDGGNATLIYTTKGEVEHDRRTLRWNLQRLARLFCVDLEAARRRHGGYLHCRQGAPLPFSASLVLVALKTRCPVGKNDGSYGYFNPAAIEKCEAAAADSAEARSIIALPGGHRVTCFYAPQTVFKRLRLGELLLERFRRELLPRSAVPAQPQPQARDYQAFLERLVLALVREAGAE